MSTLTRKWSIASIVLLAAVFGYIMFYSFKTEPVLDGFTELNEDMRLALDGGSTGGQASSAPDGASKAPSAGGKAGQASQTQSAVSGPGKESAQLTNEPSTAPSSGIDETSPGSTGTTPPGQAPAASSGSAKSGMPKGKIDINTATGEQLKLLPGIGDSKAKAIIEYRTTKGSFKTIEDIQQVKGVGPKIFENLKPYITVSHS